MSISHPSSRNNVINNSNITITSLSTKAQCKAFISEEPEEEFRHLCDWFTKTAWIAKTERQNKTYLLNKNNVIIGYFTISIAKIQLPKIKYSTRYDTYVILLGKMYVSSKVRNEGIGTIGLQVVIDIASQIHELIGCRGVVVDANSNVKTVNFYKKHGFELLNNNPKEKTQRLFFKLPDEI